MTTTTTQNKAEAKIVQHYRKTVQTLEGRLDKFRELYRNTYDENAHWVDRMAMEAECAITDLEHVVKEAKRMLSNLERIAGSEK